MRNKRTNQRRILYILFDIFYLYIKFKTEKIFQKQINISFKDTSISVQTREAREWLRQKSGYWWPLRRRCKLWINGCLLCHSYINCSDTVYILFFERHIFQKKIVWVFKTEQSSLQWATFVFALKIINLILTWSQILGL